MTIAVIGLKNGTTEKTNLPITDSVTMTASRISFLELASLFFFKCQKKRHAGQSSYGERDQGILPVRKQRDAEEDEGGNPGEINPVLQYFLDFIIFHSVSRFIVFPVS